MRSDSWRSVPLLLCFDLKLNASVGQTPFPEQVDSEVPFPEQVGSEVGSETENSWIGSGDGSESGSALFP